MAEKVFAGFVIWRFWNNIALGHIETDSDQREMFQFCQRFEGFEAYTLNTRPGGMALSLTAEYFLIATLKL